MITNRSISQTDDPIFKNCSQDSPISYQLSNKKTIRSTMMLVILYYIHSEGKSKISIYFYVENTLSFFMEGYFNKLLVYNLIKKN